MPLLSRSEAVHRHFTNALPTTPYLGSVPPQRLNPAQSPAGASSSSYPDGHIGELAAQVGNVLANLFGTESVCRTVEILRQLHADVVRAWLRAPVA
jgi:hypothetical protein